MAQVLMEILPNIQVGNIYVTLAGGCGCRDAEVEKSKCVLQLQSNERVCLEMPRGTCLVPDRVRSISQEGQVVTVRVQLDDLTSLVSILASDLMSDSGLDEKTPPSDSLCDALLSGYCKMCEGRVFECVRFRRVLPLPSVDWEHASEDWFCHIHKDDGVRLKPSSLKPEEDQCFYSELFFLVHSNVLGSLECSDDHKVSCSNCKASLGIRTEGCAKLWTHSLVWRNGEITVHSADVSSIMLTLFQNIDKDSFGVNCRLVLQVKTTPVKYLYMVTMNTNQKLLISTDRLFELGRNGTDGDPDDECVASKRVRGSEETSVRLRSVFGVKLLYVEKEGEDEESGDWADSVHVHIIPCSDSFFRQVKSLLEGTNVCLPVNIRHVERMKVGYIIK